jgi:hypothetical protein
VSTSDRPPGWSLGHPFSLADALADMSQCVAHAAELAHAEDGSPERAVARREIAGIMRRLGARIERHEDERSR